MRIAVAALILVFLLSTTICKGEENRDQEAEEADFPATKNFYLWLLQVLGTSVLLNTFAHYFGMDCMVAMLLFAGWLYEMLRRYSASHR